MLLVMTFSLKSSSQETFHLGNISTQYDVKFTIPCKNFSCEGEGIITLLRKNIDSVAFQFSVKNCAFTLRKPLDSLRTQNRTDSTIRLWNNKASIICMDFDFDGNDDFAIPTRSPHKTSKDKATFDIFLFDVREQRFKLHKELTAPHYGCCIETVKAYIWVGKGTRKRLQILWDWQGDTSGKYPVLITTRRYTFVKGKWLKKTTRRVKFRNDCE
ncbi:MAG: hypothetical protein EAZ92_02390 [Candidatus Kapaibacterium sp.]|nr:MAG: hypothetical protein EAZ92_02390 [Candidatus Kapabacteria bacterium]